MKKALLLTTFFLFLAFARCQEEIGWQLVKEIGDVRIYEQRPTDREEIDYKVVTQINASANDVANFLSTFDNYQRFLAFYASTSTLKQVGPHEFYGYGVLHPGADGIQRDIVLHTTFQQLESSWVGQSLSSPGYTPAVPGFSRDSVFKAMFVIREIKGQKNTCKYSYQVSINKVVATQSFIQQLAQTNFENVQRMRAILENTKP